MTGLQVSADSDRYVRREFVESKIMTYLEDNLIGLNLIPKIKADARAYVYLQEQSSMGASTAKKDPKTVTASSEFPEVQITRMESKAGMLNKKGFQISLDRDSITQNNTDDLDRAYKNLAFWLASDLNTEVFSTIYGGATADGVSHADWSTASTNPIDELRQVKNAMKRSGYPYRASDVYLNDTQWEELEAYLMFTDYTDTKQSRLFGWPTVNGDSMNIPGLGLDVTRVDTGISAGTLLCLDRNNPAATMYYNIDPKFGSLTIPYETMENGQKVMKSTTNFGLQINSFFEDKTRLQVIQAWFDYGIGVKAPYAALSGTGI